MLMLLGNRPLLKVKVALLLQLPIVTLLAKLSIVSAAAEMISDQHNLLAAVSLARSPLLKEGAAYSTEAAAHTGVKSNRVQQQSRKSDQERPKGHDSAKAQVEEAKRRALYVSEYLHRTNISFTHINNRKQADRRRRKHEHNDRHRRQTFSDWTDEDTADSRYWLQASEIFDTSWTMIGDTLYKVTPPASWTDAQQTCRTVNAFLAYIGDKEEENITRDFLKTLGRTRVWVGLNDRKTEGQWEWDSGEPLSYTNWIIYQPNNYKGGEHCVEFQAHNPPGFNDNKCSELFPGLCMRKGTSCGDAIIGSGTIRYPTFSSNYAVNGSCAWTIQAAPGSAGISLQIGHVLMDACCDYLRISNIFGVQLELSGIQRPQNITLDSPATITFETNSSVTGKGFTITFSSIQNDTELCGSEWTMRRGSCYRLTPAMSWKEAQQMCRSMKGFLADIVSEAQENAIYDFLDTQETARAWVGLNNRESKGQWKWDMSRAVTNLNSNRGQPDDALIVEDCAEISALYRAGFSKSDCRTHMPGLCERRGRMCNGFISGSGFIQSPGFPESYASNLDCVWTVQADPGASKVLLQVLYMATETGCDYVHISDASGFQISLSGVVEQQNITLRSPATVFFTTDYSGESEGFSIAVNSIPNHNVVHMESTRVVSIAMTTALSTIIPICVILILVFICWKRKVAFFKETKSFASSQVQSSTSGGGGHPQSSGSGASGAPLAMADSYDAISCIYESLGVDVTDHMYLRPDGVPSYVKVTPTTEIL